MIRQLTKILSIAIWTTLINIKVRHQVIANSIILTIVADNPSPLRPWWEGMWGNAKLILTCRLKSRLFGLNVIFQFKRLNLFRLSSPGFREIAVAYLLHSLLTSRPTFSVSAVANMVAFLGRYFGAGSIKKCNKKLSWNFLNLLFSSLLY